MHAFDGEWAGCKFSVAQAFRPASGSVVDRAGWKTCPRRLKAHSATIFFLPQRADTVYHNIKRAENARGTGGGRVLVGPAVFKTVCRALVPFWVGSIPMHLRQKSFLCGSAYHRDRA